MAGAIEAAFTVVRVGNIEWLLWKSTPLSRTSARTGAVSGVTLPERRPSATKMIKLRVSAAAVSASAMDVSAIITTRLNPMANLPRPNRPKP